MLAGRARLTASFVLLMTLCGCVTAARAESRAFGPFKIDDADPSTIHMDGQVAIGTGLDFRRALTAAPNARRLSLDSPGGLVAIALLIADDVHQRHLDTVVPADAGCFSACALIFFAGASRMAEGKLGVHQISSDTPDLTAAQLTISDIIDMLNQFGTPADVLTIMFRTPASDIHVFTPEEIARFGINRSAGVASQQVASTPPAPQSLSPPKQNLAEVLDTPPAPAAPPAASKPQVVTVDPISHPASDAPISPPIVPRPTAKPDRQSVCGETIRGYFSDWSQENGTALPRMGSAYAPQVVFFGKPVPRSAVLEEKRKFALRWPERSYAVRDGTINVTVADSACTVTGVVDWSASSPVLHKNPRGSASFVFELDASELPLITSESTTSLKAAPAIDDSRSAAAVQNTVSDPGNIQLVDGQCEPTSHTAEGPIGSDLTQRQSRFFCDSAVINFFPNYKGHVMVQFAQKASHHDPIVGFAGTLDDAGVILRIDHLYLTSGQPVHVDDGACKFFFKGRNLSGMACGAMVDETGRRTTAIIAFDANPGQ